MKKRLFALLCVAVMALAALPLSGCRRTDDVGGNKLCIN